jgi:flavin-dependent dehydrogenase
MNHEQYDVVVIGGGPAGSTLSTLLVRQGYRVLTIEREKFPRFHVGESLLPKTQLIWEKLGIAEPLQHLNHTFKYGGDFRIGLDPRKSDYEYSRADFYNIPRDQIQQRPYAYQVERSQFDLFLLNHARQEGVKVFEEAAVREILWEGDKATGIRWRTKEGDEYITKAACIADCSGRHAMIARSRKFLKPHPQIKTSAVFAQFKGVSRDPGIKQGYFNGYFIENGWFWFIPLHSGIMSVGLVMNEPGSSWWSKKNPEEILMTYINRYKFIRDRFARAEQFSKVRMLKGLPYSSERSVGHGWILVGDANFFVDPLFSSGVHIAFDSADKAADAIGKFLEGDRDLQPLRRYEKWSKRYQFHVFQTIATLYGLLKYRVAIESMIEFTGKYSNHLDNPPMRRWTAWIAGDFGRHYWMIYITWVLNSLSTSLGYLRSKLFNLPAWNTEDEFCSEPPLVIPKSAELLGEGNGFKPAPDATSVKDINYQEQWVVPRDFSESNNNQPELAMPGALSVEEAEKVGV